MTAPDPAWVEAGAQALVAGKTYGGWIHDEDAWRAATGIAEKVITAVEPLIRADEQDTKFAQLDHAEAVAAKLVEVICDRESDFRNALWELGVAHDMHDAVTEVLDQTRAEVERALTERDAARADANYWMEQWQIAVQKIAKEAGRG